MMQEDKELLLKDLCARLPYGIIATHKLNSNVCGLVSDTDRFGNSYVQHHGILKIDEIKPYLRPMSSMTEEEEKEIREINHRFYKNDGTWITAGLFGADDCGCTVWEMAEILNYLNAHHFDYRSLIEKGLAIKAPKDMYNLNKK